MNDSPRWCETCGSYGDHHTDRHDLVVNGINLPETYRVNGVDHSIREGVLMRRDGEQWVPVRARKRRFFSRR